MFYFCQSVILIGKFNKKKYDNFYIGPQIEFYIGYEQPESKYTHINKYLVIFSFCWPLASISADTAVRRVSLLHKLATFRPRRTFTWLNHGPGPGRTMIFESSPPMSCEFEGAPYLCSVQAQVCPSLQGRAQLSLAADAINCLWLSVCERLINERPSETPLRADNVKANPRAHSLCGAHAELLLPPPPSRPDR